MQLRFRKTLCFKLCCFKINILQIQARLIDRKDSTALVIGLDSEVASQYSRTLSLDQFIETGRPSELSFDEGVKYLVVDCGGK